MSLPEYSPAISQNPQKLFLFSHPKVGKTTLLSGLPNNFILDADDGGTSFIDGIKYDLLKRARELNQLPEDIMRSLAAKISQANRDKGDFVYDYISLDTVTGLESIAKRVATRMYKQTAVGKNFEGTDVVGELERGAGYLWLRSAFEELYGLFSGLSRNGLILMGHVKSSAIIKDGKDISAQDIDLTGKLKQIISADSDAIGILRRGKENPNQVIVSFKTTERDLATGARPPHLRNQEFIMSEYFEDDDRFEFGWDKIYLTN